MLAASAIEPNDGDTLAFDALPSLASIRQRLRGEADPARTAAELEQAVAAEFERESTDYWDNPDPNGVDASTPRMQQERRVAEHLLKEAQVRYDTGNLSAAGKRLVEKYATARYEAGQGIYGLKVDTAPGTGGAPSRTDTLAGIVVMTEKPAGYSYVEGIVRDRTERTGTTVLYMPGRDGGLMEFPSLKDAMAWVENQLRIASPLCKGLAARQTQENRALLEAPGNKSVKASLFDREVPAALVDKQIAAWKSDSLHGGQPSNARTLLDVSRSDESWRLEATTENLRSIEAGLLKDLPHLSEKEKASILPLFGASIQESDKALAYFGDVEDFRTFADKRIRARFAADKRPIADPSKIRVLIPYQQVIPIPGARRSERVNGTLSLSLTEVMANRTLSTAPANWKLDRVTFSGEGSDKLSMAYVRDTADAMDLEDDYAAMLHARFDRPKDSGAAGLYDIAREASRKAWAYEMHAHALIDKGRGKIDAEGYQMIQEALDRPDSAQRRGNGAVTVSGLVLEGNSMRHTLTFSRPGRREIVLYTPGAPDHVTFRQFADRQTMRVFIDRQLASITLPTDRWAANARYWAGQFGAHQREAVPILKQLATGHRGSALTEEPITGHFLDARQAYQVRELLADADASARTDNEVKIDKALDYAEMGYRLLSMLLPARITVPLDLAELSYKLFQGYAQMNQGMKQEAQDYLSEAFLDALSLGTNFVPGASPSRSKGRPSLSPRRSSAVAPPPARPKLGPGAPGSPLKLEALPDAGNDAAAFRPIPGDSHQGLYYRPGQAAVFAKLDDGKFYRAYKDIHTGTWRLGDPGDPATRSPFRFFNDPQIQYDAGAGTWRIAPRGGLRGGNPYEQRFGGTDYQRFELSDAFGQKLRDTLLRHGGNSRDLLKAILGMPPASPLRLQMEGLSRTLIAEAKQRLGGLFRSRLGNLPPIPRLNGPTGFEPFLHAALSKSNGLIFGELHADNVDLYRFLSGEIETLKRAGVTTLYVEGYFSFDESRLNDLSQVDAIAGPSAYGRFLAQARRAGIRIVPIDALAAKRTWTNGTPGQSEDRVFAMNHYAQMRIRADEGNRGPGGKWIAFVGAGHSDNFHISSDEPRPTVPGLGALTSAVTVRVDWERSLPVSAPTITHDPGRSLPGTHVQLRSNFRLSLPRRDTAHRFPSAYEFQGQSRISAQTQYDQAVLSGSPTFTEAIRSEFGQGEVGRLQQEMYEKAMALDAAALPALQAAAARHRKPQVPLPANATDEQIIHGVFAHSQGMVIGEGHDDATARTFLRTNLAKAKDAGVTTLYLEGLLADLDGEHLRRFMDTGEVSPVLAKLEPRDLLALLGEARRLGLRVVPLDSAASNYNFVLEKKDLSRLRAGNHYMQMTIENDAQRGQGKWIALVGAAHTDNVERPSTGDVLVPGLSDATGAVSIHVDKAKTVRRKPGQRSLVPHYGTTLFMEGQSVGIGADYRLSIP